MTRFIKSRCHVCKERIPRGTSKTVDGIPHCRTCSELSKLERIMLRTVKRPKGWVVCRGCGKTWKTRTKNYYKRKCRQCGASGRGIITRL